MTYKAGDQVRDEFNVPIHKLIFQKIKKTCGSGKPGWIILDENKNEFTSCFIEDFDLIEKYLVSLIRIFHQIVNNHIQFLWE